MDHPDHSEILKRFIDRFASSRQTFVDLLRFIVEELQRADVPAPPVGPELQREPSAEPDPQREPHVASIPQSVRNSQAQQGPALPNDICRPFYGSGIPEVDAAIGYVHGPPRASCDQNIDGRQVTEILSISNIKGISIRCHVVDAHGRWHQKVEHFTFLRDESHREQRIRLLRDWLSRRYPAQHSPGHGTKSLAYRYFIDVIMSENPLSVALPRRP